MFYEAKKTNLMKCDKNRKKTLGYEHYNPL